MRGDTQERFGRTADRLAAHQDERAAALADRVRGFLVVRGHERALDVGTGAGALALALAPLVREVVAVDVVPELIEEARKRAPENVEVVEADATALPFEAGSFDLVGTLLVVDQIAPVDPLAALELNRFERARDPSTTRILADVDLRSLFDANGLVLRRSEVVREPRELESYLDLAGCEGDARERAAALAPPRYTAEIGWYMLTRPSP